MQRHDVSRRGFCEGALAFAAGMGLRPVFAAPERRWYKGMLHCHTHWSDGHAFPEQAARAYRDAGYNFLCISDHNRFAANLDFWRDVCELEGGWPPNVWQPIFNSYRNEFPDAEFVLFGQKDALMPLLQGFFPFNEFIFIHNVTTFKSTRKRITKKTCRVQVFFVM